ncbi:MAG: hypothetical protein LBP95_00890 [Deltaproteobacteria bacterium]|jgi:hypothetical protein|nr:hypothetical protein [Deltaproteobacteria bacterium]
MADIKTIVVRVPEIREFSGPGCDELLKNGAVFSDYRDGEIAGLSDADAGRARAENLETALARLKDGRDLVLLRLERPVFEAGLLELLEKSDRRTILAVVSPDRLVFYGFGVANKAGVIRDPAAAADVLPTLAMVGEFFLEGSPAGRVLYRALKNPNFKQVQIEKLKAALGRLEKMLKRENREPWDKHDCA